MLSTRHRSLPSQVDASRYRGDNRWRFQEGKFWGLVDYVICTLLRKNPTPASNCIGCGKCEKHCPQHLPIRQKLGEAQKELEGPLYRTVRKVLGKFAKF